VSNIILSCEYTKKTIISHRYGVDNEPHALYAALALRRLGIQALASPPLIEQRTPLLRLPAPRFGAPRDAFLQRTRQLRPYAALLHPSMRHTAMFAVDLYEQFKSITAKNKRWYDQRARDLAVAFNEKLARDVAALRVELAATSGAPPASPSKTEL
jgi:hypothetical protein